MSILPATIFGQFGWHLLGIAVACAVATIAFYGHAFDGKLGRMALFWLTATALSALLVFAAAIFGATLLITSVMVEEINNEFREPPEYSHELPSWRRRPHSEDTTQSEDIQ